MTAGNDPQAGDAAAADEATATPAGGAEDVKRRFREALDKKHAHGGRDVSGSGGGAKVHESHGPASTQRTFRRKSG